MNDTPLSPAPRRSSNWLLGWFLGAVLIFALVILGIASFFRLSREARSLRDSFISLPQHEAGHWDKKMELSVGAMTCQLVRAGLSFAPLDTEARAAVQAVRGAEVGIYRLSSHAIAPGHSAILSAADQAMTRRGWERLVAVSRERDLVTVYVPKNPSHAATMQACIAVLTDRKLVVVCARSNLEPLMELALNQPKWLDHVRAPL